MPPAPAPTPSVPNDDPDAPKNNLRYFGRFEFDKGAGSARVGWNGAYIKANFDGTSISATLKTQEKVAWDVVIDDTKPTLIYTDASSHPVTVPLASGLAPGSHTIDLRKRSETRATTVTFDEFVVSGGPGLLPRDQVPELAFEFYGDSWLAGYGAGVSTSGSEAFVSASNGADSYGPVASRAMGAEYHLQAWGGMSWGHSTPEELDVKGRLFPSDGDTMYDTKRWRPDVVVVDMGRNDGHSCCKPEYETFIQWLQSSYGKDIPVVICSQDNQPFYRDVYHAEKEKGSNVFLWTDFLSADLGPLVLGHPTKAAHERFAKKLQFFLESEVLPTIRQTNQTASTRTSRATSLRGSP